MTEILVANDIGTTRIKSACVYKAQPNRSNEFETDAVLGEVKELLVSDDDLMKIEAADGAWFVGESVTTHRCRNQIWSRGGERWFLGPHYLALHLYAIAQHTAPTAREIDVYLTSALPRADWGLRDKIANRLKGEHEVRTPDRAAPLTIRIKEVCFGIQGWVAILAEGHNGLDVAWLGLGGRNKTYATIVNGRPDADRTDSREGGILDVVDDLEKAVSKTHRIEMPKMRWIKALEQESIQIGAERVDISREVGGVVAPYLEASIGLVRDIWNEREVLPFISDFRLGGGGVKVKRIGQTLVDAFPGFNLRIVDRPRWAEAYGLLSMAKARWL